MDLNIEHTSFTWVALTIDNRAGNKRKRERDRREEGKMP